MAEAQEVKREDKAVAEQVLRLMQKLTESPNSKAAIQSCPVSISVPH